MIKGTIYDSNTGAIRMTVVCGEPEALQAQCMLDPALKAFEGEEYDAQEWYFVNDEPTNRPEMGVQFQVDGVPMLYLEGHDIHLTVGQVLQVDGIPVNTMLMHPGGKDFVDDGFFDWSTEHPGTYEFNLQNFPMKGVIFNAIVA